jgi:hypothetical protein
MTGPMMFGLKRRKMAGKDSHGFILFGSSLEFYILYTYDTRSIPSLYSLLSSNRIPLNF